jgi:hypothetical protein
LKFTMKQTRFTLYTSDTDSIYIWDTVMGYAIGVITNRHRAEQLVEALNKGIGALTVH